MCEVDRLAYCLKHLIYLICVEDVRQVCLLGDLFESCPLHGRECELTLLHVVVNCLIEVLAHVSFKDHWEVVSIPISLGTSL